MFVLLYKTLLLATEDKTVPSTQKCIKLQQINLNENKLLDKEVQEKLFTPYYDTCLNSQLIKKLLATISQYYMNKGYITTKPYLPSQNILDGKIDISVAKGLVEDIVEKNATRSNSNINSAFLFQKGEVLNLRDLETSLEMMNRPPFIDAKFDIKPEKTQGKSIVEINTKKDFPLHLNIGMTGEKTIYNENPYLTGQLSIDNPLNLNDILKFTSNGSSIQKDYQSQLGQEINYSFPLSSYLIESIWYNFDYKQEVLGLNDTYTSSGTTEGATLRISKIVYRDTNSKLNIAFALLHKNTKNYFSDALIEVSSYKTTQAQLDVKYTFIPSWGEIINTYSFYKGTDWFGARNDSYFNGSTKERLQFSKHTLSINLYYYFADSSYQINSNFYLQYSHDRLYDNNKLRVGSYYTVRGYTSSYYGDSGGYLYNDFIKTFNVDFYPALVKNISPFIGLDYGYAECSDSLTQSCGTLTGVAIGFKSDSKYLQTDFTWSRALKEVSNNKIQTLFRYNINLKI